MADSFSHAATFNVEVPPINLIFAEILAVTSAMRKNQRWASSSSSSFLPHHQQAYLLDSSPRSTGMSSTGSRQGLLGASGGEGRDAVLMNGFMSLRMEMREIADLSQLDALTLLHPFLEVVRSPDTSGPITATALSSIDKFITYSILHPGSPSLREAMAQLSTAATHCKFEASDSISDEVVLLKILDVLRNCATGSLAAVLSDESVCEMMETGLSMCCQMRLSEMLRKSAERTMQAMIAAVFSKLRFLPLELETEGMPDNLAPREDDESTVTTGVRMGVPDARSATVNATVAVIPNEDVVDEQELAGPFGLASMTELLRVLTSLLNPHDQQHTDSMRLMALGLLNVAFEVAGKSIGVFPALRLMVADQLCKHLFQLARSDNLQLLSTSLRVITNIFDTMRGHLKLQQELFLSFLLDRLVLPQSILAPGSRKGELESQLDATTWAATDAEPLTTGTSTPLGNQEKREKESRAGAEAREMMMEVLGHLARGQYAMLDLYVNYDCNIECEDVFERLVKFLSRGVYPPVQTAPFLLENSQLICLDTILEQVKHMRMRLDTPVISSSPSFAQDLSKSKITKQILLDGAAAFNLKPKVGLQFLEQHGVIYSDPLVPREESLAEFFKTTPRLDKKLLGDFISRPDQLEVLRAFMRMMKFDGKIICDAMRELLEAFRLPGESQQIARITETFAEVYFGTNPPDIKSQDATYVLSYSVIMLNTDLHNPQVRKRMDIDAYSRNLRGVNDNSDFSPEYLKSIYDSIRKREIVMPEEHQNQVGFEYGWKELLRRTQQAGFFTLNATSELDRDMFVIAWRPMVSAMSFAFANFSDDYMVQRTIAGFNQCAALAARFEMPEVFDFLILSLSRVTGLARNLPSPDLGSYPFVEVEGQKVTISPLSVRFGLDVKAQLAAVVLFTIANNNGKSIGQGWSTIFEIYQTLFIHSLLPPSLLKAEDFLSGASVIPLKPKTAPVVRERRNDGGLLSTLSSYLLSPYSSSSDAIINDLTDDDIETTLSGVDCIASCRIEELYAQIVELRGAALITPVRILVALAAKATVDRVKSKSPVINDSSSPSLATAAPTTAVSRSQLPYDPSAVLLLEILASIVVKSPDSILDLWPLTFDYLGKLLASATSFSSLFNERVVAALLRVLAVVIRRDELRDATFIALDMLRELPPTVLSTVGEPLMAGLSQLIVNNANRISSSTEWNLIFALFTATIQQEEAAKLSFDLMRRLASGELGVGVRSDNYGAFLQVLSAFANVGSSAERASDEAALQRGQQIVDILRDIQASMPHLIESSPLSAAKAWETAWIPLLSSFSQLCLNPSRELRQIAISNLQRTLLAPEILTNDSVDLAIIFEQVFFPMLDELLKPQIFRRDPGGMGETRLRASALLCKIFLHYLTQLSERQGMQKMTDLWLQILGYQDRFMHSGRRDQMYEAVPESLKNVLLVMNATGFLLPPHVTRTPEQANLWDATFEKIQPFLPELRDDLFPAPEGGVVVEPQVVAATLSE